MKMVEPAVMSSGLGGRLMGPLDWSPDPTQWVLPAIESG